MAEYSFQSQVCDLLNNLSTNGKYITCTLKEVQSVEYIFYDFRIKMVKTEFEHLVKPENSHQRAHFLIIPDRQNKKNCGINLPVLSYKEEKIAFDRNKW